MHLLHETIVFEQSLLRSRLGHASLALSQYWDVNQLLKDLVEKCHGWNATLYRVMQPLAQWKLQRKEETQNDEMSKQDKKKKDRENESTNSKNRLKAISALTGEVSALSFDEMSNVDENRDFTKRNFSDVTLCTQDLESKDADTQTELCSNVDLDEAKHSGK